MPRPKLCGGWVSSRAQRFLGFAIPAEVVNHQFRHLELCCGESGSTFSPPDPFGVFVDRAVFDSFLLRHAENAGVAIKFERAVGIVQSANAITVQTAKAAHTAAVAIMCTGAAGSLSASLRPADPPRKSGVCLEQRVPVEFAANWEIPPGTARLFFGEIPFGYGWILHHGTYVLIGVGCRRTSSRNLRQYYGQLCDQLALSDDLRAPQGHPIPLGGFRRLLGRGRCLLAGDAAGFVDAFTGEGISYAIRSGQLAAEVLTSVSDRDPVGAYQHACSAEILRPIRQSLWMARVFHHLPRRQLRRLCENPATASGYYEILEGRSNYVRYALRQIARAVL